MVLEGSIAEGPKPMSHGHFPEISRDLLCHSSGGQKPQITVSAGSCLLQRRSGRLGPMPPSWLSVAALHTPRRRVTPPTSASCFRGI